MQAAFLPHTHCVQCIRDIGSCRQETGRADMRVRANATLCAAGK